MDDYSMSSLTDSKNEWCARLINILTPVTIQGVKSIFDEAHNLCKENDEMDKYLMTFQTFLSRVPKWNNTIVEAERKRIVEASGCTYLEELITCVHVIQLKTLTCVRVGQKQKKVDIDVPSVDEFIHKIYINVARKLYTNIYLFEKNIAPLQVQKHNRELELIIKECIMNSVRESIPVETILRAYMDEADEHDIEVNETEEQIPIVEEDNEPVPTLVPSTPVAAPATASTTAPVVDNSQTRLSFSDIDKAVDVRGIESSVSAPKTLERLESLALLKAQTSEDADEDEDDDEERLQIGGDISLDISDVNDLNRPIKILPPPILDDIEILS
jgi:hypothetical protein